MINLLLGTIFFDFVFFEPTYKIQPCKNTKFIGFFISSPTCPNQTFNFKNQQRNRQSDKKSLKNLFMSYDLIFFKCFCSFCFFIIWYFFHLDLSVYVRFVYCSVINFYLKKTHKNTLVVY